MEQGNESNTVLDYVPSFNIKKKKILSPNYDTKTCVTRFSLAELFLDEDRSNRVDNTEWHPFCDNTGRVFHNLIHLTGDFTDWFNM